MRILFQLLSVIQREEEEERLRVSVSDETGGGGGNEAIQLERRGFCQGSLRRSASDTVDKSASSPLMGFLFWS